MSKKKRNLAVSMMPQTLDDIIGQDAAVNEIKRFLETDTHPFSIFLSGDSGSGKGTLIHNYIKALHCLNRPKGSYVACGKCAQCKLDPKTKGKFNGSIWVQSGQGTDTINKQVKDALAEALEPPRTMDLKRDHSNYRVIVFDELQSIGVNIIENLLFASETEAVVGKNRVIFILVTMSEDRLIQKDPQLTKALIDRTNYIRLRRPNKEELVKYAKTRLGLTSKPIIDVITEAADGSYRGLIRCYDKIKYYLDRGADADLCADVVYITSASRRRRLWELLNKSSTTQKELKAEGDNMMRQLDKNQFCTLKKFWEDTIEKGSDETRLLNQLLNDLDKSRELGHDVPLEYDRLIIDYLMSSRSIGSWHLIKQLKGKNLVDLKIFDDYDEPKDGLERRAMRS